MKKREIITAEGIKIPFSNPEKLLWADIGIRKIDYLAIMTELAPYILPHTKSRHMTYIRYPDGIGGKSFFQKNAPAYTPGWVSKSEWNNINYIVLDSVPTLIWLANQAVLEFHPSFNLIDKVDYPTSLVFDLDPSQGQEFDDVIEAAFLIKETLDSLSITSFVKTSGATGLQIFIPAGGKYEYDTARKINEFFGRYFSQKYPNTFTIERLVGKRGKKLYFDYMQMWQGKTITSVYSPRATPMATISMPVQWDELIPGIKPEDFTILNALARLKDKGDLFEPLLAGKQSQNLDEILDYINNKT